MYPASAPAYIMGKTLHGISGVFIGLGPIQVLLIINVCQSCLCLRAFSELVDRASVREFQGKTVAHWLLLRINFPNSTRAPKSIIPALISITVPNRRLSKPQRIPEDFMC